jgi:hypothetical protein
MRHSPPEIGTTVQIKLRLSEIDDGKRNPLRFQGGVAAPQ